MCCGKKPSSFRKKAHRVNTTACKGKKGEKYCRKTAIASQEKEVGAGEKRERQL